MSSLSPFKGGKPCKQILQLLKSLVMYDIYGSGTHKELYLKTIKHRIASGYCFITHKIQMRI